MLIFKSCKTNHPKSLFTEKGLPISLFGKGAGTHLPNYTYQDAEAKGDPLPDVPKHNGNAGVNLYNKVPQRKSYGSKAK
ncbi:MAG: hypothetical protein ACUZ8H_09930 [Candidatus Anammoxibacter sp.]